MLMSDYADKLSSIVERRQKLLEEETKLIEKRKEEIWQLAEKFGLIALSDAAITGLFSEVQSAVKDEPEKIKSWESYGEQFLKPKRSSRAAQESAT